MRKRGLKDVKRRNRQVIMETVLENSGLSRVEITQKTELAGSTVSALVGELLEEGILAEAGTVTTAGRSRTALTVNPAYGSIVVFEIGRRESCATCFDMALKPIRTQKLARKYMAGNELLGRINHCMASFQQEIPPVVGIGLLFQEDMRESDFRVMYSTGFSSASITLREALMTQYRIPIEEEYSVSYTVNNAMARELEMESGNNAHISVGSRVLAKVTLEGREVPLRKNFCEELAAAMDWEDPRETGDAHTGMLVRLSQLIAVLCTLFALDAVLLSGMISMPPDSVVQLQQLLVRRLPSGRLPRLEILQAEPVSDTNRVIARQVLRKALLAL